MEGAGKRGLECDIIRRAWPLNSSRANSGLKYKVQGLVYEILPSITTIVDYAKGLENLTLSANEQFFDDTHTAVSL